MDLPCQPRTTDDQAVRKGPLRYPNISRVKLGNRNRYDRRTDLERTWFEIISECRATARLEDAETWSISWFIDDEGAKARPSRFVLANVTKHLACNSLQAYPLVLGSPYEVQATMLLLAPS